MKKGPLQKALLPTGLDNSPPASWSGHQALSGETMKCAHREKLRLCDALEKLADQLPNVDRLQCLNLANTIVPLMRDVHRYEEAVVFPAYEAALTLVEASLSSVSRLRAEHIEDECFAGEVTEALLAIGHGGGTKNAEAVGFMLRGFFESLRRHVAFEREHVLPRIGIDG